MQVIVPCRWPKTSSGTASRTVRQVRGADPEVRALPEWGRFRRPWRHRVAAGATCSRVAGASKRHRPRRGLVPAGPPTAATPCRCGVWPGYAASPAANPPAGSNAAPCNKPESHPSKTPTEIHTVLVGDEPHVVIRPAIENMGLDASAQIKKLKTRSWATVAETATVADDGKVRLMTTVNLDTWAMLLANIDENRVAGSVRELVIRYQRESAKALRDYWARGSATNPRVDQPISRSREMEAEESAAAARRHLGIINAMGDTVSTASKEGLIQLVWVSYASAVGLDTTVVPQAAPTVRSEPDPPDRVEQWLAETCEPYGPGTRGSHLYATLIDWCRARGIADSDQPTMTRLGRRLNTLGYPARRGSIGCRYRPLRVV
ncbi:phage antirepressor N-terminal domain-containing protein [Actinoplanes sp. ATCC 53533]|uniref:phage antirepressor N-terminal domain-containing protein n=1 Tax=Actinoplanes sp. ATCC 53533 TaxID=1288362 RepID=UPI003514AA56